MRNKNSTCNHRGKSWGFQINKYPAYALVISQSACSTFFFFFRKYATSCMECVYQFFFFWRQGQGQGERRWWTKMRERCKYVVCFGIRLEILWNKIATYNLILWRSSVVYVLVSRGQCLVRRVRRSPIQFKANDKDNWDVLHVFTEWLYIMAVLLHFIPIINKFGKLRMQLTRWDTFPHSALWFWPPSRWKNR